MAESPKKFKDGDIVWVDLGYTYGWWPGIVHDERDKENASDNAAGKPGPSGEGQKEKKPQQKYQWEFAKDSKPEQPRQCKGPLVTVRFFDDETRNYYQVEDPEKRLRPYSNPDKVQMIQNGLTKFGEKKANVMYDDSTRQAQFYKDVEQAEVMTDCDPAVAKILMEFEVYGPEEEEKVVPKKKPRRRRRK